MGNARARGSYAERKADAKAAGRTERVQPRSDRVAKRSILSDLFGWHRAKGTDGKDRLFKTRSRPVQGADARGRGYIFDGVSVRRARQTEDS
jgi:hypothetical protein